MTSLLEAIAEFVKFDGSPVTTAELYAEFDGEASRNTIRTTIARLAREPWWGIEQVGRGLYRRVHVGNWSEAQHQSYD